MTCIPNTKNTAKLRHSLNSEAFKMINLLTFKHPALVSVITINCYYNNSLSQSHKNYQDQLFHHILVL